MWRWVGTGLIGLIMLTPAIIVGVQLPWVGDTIFPSISAWSIVSGIALTNLKWLVSLFSTSVLVQIAFEFLRKQSLFGCEFHSRVNWTAIALLLAVLGYTELSGNYGVHNYVGVMGS